ncbi:hypothetical protein CYY_002537 [Polysphondylium violaceum]|uniref:Saposin B-type domain-containing protein n=1 Tax=Polysphondylium violaceum TaxID=133409 RepID=A0A8J4V2E5_9MYCE|nr:hypothetical protein CYY_002537 [Polysphondylium violaceum]
MAFFKSFVVLALILVCITASYSLRVSTPSHNDRVEIFDQNNNVESIPLCILCNIVVTETAKYLNNKANETEIIDGVEHDCKILHDQHDVDECTKIVNNYLPEIIDLIKENKKAVCAEIGLCL